LNAFAVELILDPAFQHVDQLQFRFMQMLLANFVSAWRQ